VVVVLSVIYFRALSGKNVHDMHGYAPAAVSVGLESQYALVYAVAAGLAAWESGRLKADGVWRLAPARSRLRIAAGALVPVWVLAWLTLLWPVVAWLVRVGSAPTAGCLPLLAMPLVVTVAYSVIGFTVGAVVNRYLAAPILIGVVWYAVAASWSFSTHMWTRDVLGQYPSELAYGELPEPVSLLTHVLFVGGLGAGVLVWAVARLPWLPRAALGVAVVLAGTLPARALADGWGADTPLSEGNVTVRCTGAAPSVCLPAISADRAPEVRREYAEVVADFRQTGVTVRAPRTITDSILSGSSGTPSSATVWRLPVTGTADGTRLRFSLARLAVMPRCAAPRMTQTQRIALWIGEVTGTQGLARAREREEAFTPAQQASLRTSSSRVTAVRKLSAHRQSRWYTDTLRAACSASPEMSG
jgi:hypothetical protein